MKYKFSFLESLNSLFENKRKRKVQADIQVPVPLQSVKSRSQKNRWNHCSAKFYTMHLDAVVLAGYSKHVHLSLPPSVYISGAAGGSPAVCFGVCKSLRSSICGEGVAAALACTGCDSRTSRASLCCAKECRR